jgi:hypothetical protein
MQPLVALTVELAAHEIGRSGGALALQAEWIPDTNTESLSVLASVLAALVTPGIRYRYSTEHALFYILTVVILAVSPFTTRVFGLQPWFFLGGFTIAQVVAVVVDYLYRVVSGESTGVDAFRTVAGDWISRLRDRRRKVRRRIEAILDRKTVIAVLVGMPLSELMKVTGLQFLAAEPIQWHLAWANLALVLTGLVIGIHWKHVKEAAESAGDTAEGIVDGNDDGA